ncbi:Hypothetical predicted protein [Mytilus galloprovincialis]|uniref:Uncharacterized protein n=1 Tax=Mytilus galloprovincialis TaxID=29158 RepID=A0A8B6GUT6_MYTGA|nr:Hypothetical predicted protein [Mytilus galloprovincialis]
MAHLLVRNGAKVNLRAWCAMKIPILVTGSKIKLTSLLLQYDLNQTELHIAVRQNDLKKLRSNITSKNINSRTKSGWTVLHYAVILNNVEAVMTLLQEVFSKNEDSNLDSVQDAKGDIMYRMPKPKISIVDSNGLTAVHLAVAHNYTKILSLLLRNGGKIRVHDDFDRTPLHYTKSDCALKYLLSHGCQNNYIGTCRSAEEENGYTRNSLSAFRTVWSNISQHTALGGVCRNFVNMPDKEGNTPLHSVIKRCLSEKVKRDCIKTLLHNGADPYLCNDSGLSVFEIIDCNSEATKYINYSETYRKLIEKTHAVFALAMLTLIALTIAIPLYVSIFISQESQNSVYCIGQVVESGAVILETMKLSRYGTSSKQSEIRRDTFVAALDIGTTFSGYAISLLTDYNKDPLNIQTFNWISRFDGHVTYKMPSDLLFRPDGTFHSFGYDAEYNYANAKPSDRGTQVMVLLQFIQDDALFPFIYQLYEENLYYIGILRIKRSGRDRRIERSKLSLALEPEAAAIFCQHVPTTRQTYIGFPPSLASAKDTILKYLVVDLGVLQKAIQQQLFGRNPHTVKARVTRKTYGVRSSNNYDPDKHPPEKRNVLNGQLVVGNIFDTHIISNQIAEVGQKFAREINYPVIDSQSTVTVEIYTADGKAPLFVTDRDPSYLGKLVVELHSSRKNLLNSNSRKVQVRFKFDGTEIEVEAMVIKTKEIVSAKFDFLG